MEVECQRKTENKVLAARNTELAFPEMKDVGGESGV